MRIKEEIPSIARSMHGGADSSDCIFGIYGVLFHTLYSTGVSQGDFFHIVAWLCVVLPTVHLFVSVLVYIY